ncbi:MAG: amidohydrolase family protein [Burkholderiales bacterium]
MQRRDCLRAMVGALGVLAAPGSRAAEGPVALPTAPMIPGPDPNPATPSFKAPANAVDTHCHVFGPVARFPYAASRPYTPPEAPLAAFDALHRRIGIDRAVIVTATVYGTDNAATQDAIARSGGRYRGMAIVGDTTTDRELEDLARAGFDGCRLTFITRLGGTPDVGAIERIARRVAPLGWHVDLYIEAKALPAFADTLRALPVNYVLDHMGVVDAAQGVEQPAFRALLAQLRTDPKCFVKLTGAERISAAGPPFHDAVPFARALIEAAPDRVLWGTDWPHPNVKVMPNDGALVDLIPLYAPEPAQQHKLLVANPERLYRFPKA